MRGGSRRLAHGGKNIRVPSAWSLEREAEAHAVIHVKMQDVRSHESPVDIFSHDGNDQLPNPYVWLVVCRVAVNYSAMARTHNRFSQAT